MKLARFALACTVAALVAGCGSTDTLPVDSGSETGDVAPWDVPDVAEADAPADTDAVPDAVLDEGAELAPDATDATEIEADVPPKPFLSARKVTKAADLIGGEGAYGQLDHAWLLENSRARFLIQDKGTAVHLFLQGGNLIDADVKRAGDEPGNDQWREMEPIVGFRICSADSIEVVEDGSDGKEAVIRVTGTDQDTAGVIPLLDQLSQPLGITIINEYVLEPDVPWLRLRTWAVNPTTVEMEGVGVGDFLAFGGTQKIFMPESGFDAKGPDVAAILSTGRGASYGYTVASGTINVPTVDASGTAGILGTISIPPNGGKTSFERYFIVGTGDLASVMDAVHELRKDAVVTVSGTVADKGAVAIPGAKVTATVPDKTGGGRHAVSQAAVGADGAWTMTLPAGSHRFIATAPGRVTVSMDVEVKDGVGGVDLVMDAAGRFGLSVTEVDSANPDQAMPLGAVPGKATLICKDDGTSTDPTVNESDSSCARETDPGWTDTERWCELEALPIPGAKDQPCVVVFSAHGKAAEVAVKPGRYKVVVSLGPEYETFVVDDVEVKTDAVTWVDAELFHSVDTKGYLAADFHQHTLGSIDAGVSPYQKVIENLVERVELATDTDHDMMRSYWPTIQVLKAGTRVKALNGDEVSVTTVAHFNPIGVTDDLYTSEGAPGASLFQHIGTKLYAKKTVPELVTAMRAIPGVGLVQANHPRSGGSGYFTFIRFDPTTGTKHNANEPMVWDFDMLELKGDVGLVTDYLADNDPTIASLAAWGSEDIPPMRDWFAFLNLGHPACATGNSDSSNRNEGAGYPRTMLRVGDGTPDEFENQAIFNTVKNQSAVVSQGAFLQVFHAGAEHMGIHDLVGPDDDGKAVIRVKVQAPTWIDVSSLEVYANGRPVMLQEVGGHLFEKSGTLETKLLTTAIPVPETVAGPVVRADVEIEFYPTVDTWYVFLVRGKNSLYPVAGGGVVAYTNPIYFDMDGGGFKGSMQ
jgi:hypothetical protein